MINFKSSHEIRDVILSMMKSMLFAIISLDSSKMKIVWHVLSQSEINRSPVPVCCGRNAHNHNRVSVYYCFLTNQEVTGDLTKKFTLGNIEYTALELFQGKKPTQKISNIGYQIY